MFPPPGNLLGTRSFLVVERIKLNKGFSNVLFLFSFFFLFLFVFALFSNFAQLTVPTVSETRLLARQPQTEKTTTANRNYNSPNNTKKGNHRELVSRRILISGYFAADLAGPGTRTRNEDKDDEKQPP